jgi:hypothetical protein
MADVSTTWLETFGIGNRLGTPDLAIDGQPDSVMGLPHASAMRAAFEERSVDGFLSIDGVPMLAFAERSDLDPEEINRLHKALWNQGLASLLLVHLPTEVLVYSLWEKPLTHADTLSRRDRRLVETLSMAADAMRLRALVPEVESGNYFHEHQKHFDPRTRIDAMLLANLRETRKRLVVDEKLPDDFARVLILQVIFIGYLEDRGIIDREDFQAAVGIEYGSLLDVLSARDPLLFERLFDYLRPIFNGDVFFGPGVFDVNDEITNLESRHLAPIADFREGRYEMDTGQSRFWPYDFRFIPVELISAIYDRFLNADDKARKESGAYFTPRFLADLVVDQVWNALDPETRSAGRFSVLDPACGSALFLVRMFQKIIEEHKRNNEGQAPDWWGLRKHAGRLHGWDIQKNAVRIGVFSLYVALLEQVHPPTLRALRQQGKLLPLLLGKTLCQRDFFEERDAERRFDVIVGNPPWVSRKAARTKTALDWCMQRGHPVPEDEIAWAFLWKAAEHLLPNGRIALLLPAMGILLNHSKRVSAARRAWLEGIEVLRIVNFADVCFQLFEGADRPTILALYRLSSSPGRDYEIEYWVPKTHRLLGATRVLIIPSIDRMVIRMSSARRDPSIWKKRMWATDRDMKLLRWLSDLPKLGHILITYRQATTRRLSGSEWIIGQGFKPFDETSQSPHHTPTEVKEVTEFPFLDADKFQRWVMPTVRTSPWPTAKVHRRGFVDGYKGPHILVPQGVIREQGFLRAAYTEQSLSFRHAIQAIKFPSGNEGRAKFLTALLNSSLAAWYYFHTSANFGADRAKVHEAQVLELPFPRPEQCPDPVAASRAEARIVCIIDELLAHRDDLLSYPETARLTHEADRLVFDYFGLTNEERKLIEDTVSFVIPSMQPRKDSITPLLSSARGDALELYANTLVQALGEWMRAGTEVIARLLSGGSEAAVMELRLGSEREDLCVDVQPDDLQRVLHDIFARLPVTMSRNLELHPDLKVFIDDALYLGKPLGRRYWLPSTALNDADQIAADLLSIEARARRTASNERYR